MVQQQAPTWVGQARRRDQTIANISMGTDGLGFSSQPQFVDLPNIGYLDEIKVNSQAAFTTGAGAQAVVDPRGIFAGVLQRETVVVNSIGNLYDCDGDVGAIIAAIDNNYRFVVGNRFLGPPSSLVDATASTTGAVNTALTASHAYILNWNRHIPLGVQLANLPYPVGFFQTALQNLSVRYIARLLPFGITGTTGGATNALTALYQLQAAAVSTAMSGQVQLAEKYFDPIAAPTAQPYLGYIHRWTQYNIPISGSGDVTINLPGQNYYSRIGWMVVAGTAGALLPQGTFSAAGVANYMTRARLMYGANYAPYDYDESHHELGAKMRTQYGTLMDSATVGSPGFPNAYLLDFLQETHDNRDWINAAATTNLRLLLTMGSGGTYGAGSYVAVFIEEFAPLTLPAAASVQGNPSVPAGAVPGAG